MAGSQLYRPGQQAELNLFTEAAPTQPGNQLTVGNVSWPKAASGQGATGLTKAQAMMKFFGQPTDPSKLDTTSTYDEYEVETYDLPDAYRGPNRFLRQLVIDIIKDADVFPIRSIAPLKREENNMEVAWDVWQFNSGLLGRTPEESVSRLLTSEFSSHRDSMVRYGLAMVLEHGFWKTPMGEKAYVMQLQQISNATIDTLAYGALFYVYNCHPFRDPHAGHRIEPNASLNSLDRAFQEEIESWAMLQKDEDGLSIMYNKMQEEYGTRNNGEEGNIFVLPNGAKMYAAGRPENNYFYFTGRSKGTVDPLPGVAVHETRPVRQGADKPADDPAYRERTIGGFFQMLGNHLDHVPAEEYQTSMRDTYIYSETTDDDVRISFKDAVRHLGLYDLSATDNDHHYPSDRGYLGADADFDQHVRKFPTYGSSVKIPATSHGIRFWGSLTNWGKAYEHTGLLNKALQKLLALDAETLVHFLKKFGHAKQVFDADEEQDGESEEIERHEREPEQELTFDDEKEATSDDFTRDRSRRVKGMMAAARQQPGDAKRNKKGKGKGKGIQGEAYFTPVRARNASSELYNRLGERIGELPTEYKNVNTLLEQYQAASRNVGKDDGNGLVETVYKLREEFYSADRDAAVVELAQEYGGDDSRLTGVEAKLISTPHNQQVKESELRAANNIAWLPRGDGFPNEKALLLVSVQKHHTVPLRQPSDAFSFTTKHAVLFDLTKDQYKTFFTNKGVISFSSRDTDESLYSERLALLQYSVTISALYFRISHLLEKGAPTKAAIQKVIPELKALVSQSHPLGDTYSLAEDLMGAVSDKHLESLTGQFLLSDVIETLQSLTIHLFSGDDEDSTIISEVQKVIGAHFAGKTATPSRHSIGRDVHHALAAAADLDVSLLTSIQRVTPGDKDEIDAFAAEGKKAFDEVLVKGVGSLFPSKEEWESISQYLITQYVVTKKKHASLNAGKFVTLVLLAGGVAKKLAAKAGASFQETLYFIAGHTFEPLSHGGSLENTAENKVPTTKEIDEATAQEDEQRREFEVRQKRIAEELATHLTKNIANIKDARFKSGAGLGKPIRGSDVASKVEANVPSWNKDAANDRKEPASIHLLQEILFTLPTSDGEYLLWALENNVPVPLGVVGWRPHKRYLAGTAIVMRGGGEAAFTWYGKADFQLGSNVNQKMTLGHFTMYAKTIVHNTRKIVHHYNAYIKEYLGGNGHSYWDPLNAEDKAEYDAGELTKDIFFTAVLPSFRVTQNHMSLTGSYPAQMNASAEAQSATNWGASSIYNDMWGWKVSQHYNPITEHHSRNAGAQFNVVCFQEYQRLYNHKGNKTGEFDLYIIDKGHWGPRIYAGCGQVRRGKRKYLYAPSYLSQKTSTLTP